MRAPVLVVLLLFTALVPAAADDRAVRIGYEHSPPVQLVDDQGHLRGPVFEMLSKAAALSKVRLEWIHCPEGPDRALASGRVDLWPLIADIPARRGKLTITPPYLRSRYWLISREDTGIHSLAEVRGRQVLRQPGLLSEALAQQFLSEARVEVVNGLTEALSRVCRGEAESALVAQGSGDHLLMRDRGCDIGQLNVAALPGVQLDFGIGARRGNRPAERAAAALQNALIELFDDGQMAAIWLRWGLIVTETRVLADYLSAQRYGRNLTAISALLLVAFAIALWQTLRWRRAQRAAQAAAEAKQAFLANMSHEIRTPMNGVLGLASLLEESDLTPEQREYVRTIRQSSSALLRLLNDILDVAKMEAGKFRLVEEDFDLRQTVMEVAHLCVPQAEAKGLEWRLDWNPEVAAHWHGDGMRVRQVLLNLVGNAVKFTHQGAVGLRVEPTPHGVRLSVSDTGPGIDGSLRQRLFETFVQGEQPPAGGLQGSGLGLAITRALVERMNGKISVETQVGRGTTFSVDLPLQPAAPLPAPAPEAAPVETPGGGRRVLVVEDNSINQFVAQRMLGRLGCEVELAADGHEAIGRLARERFDLVFMDCGLPGLDGYEVTRQLRALEQGEAHTPVIAMTAAALAGDRERCLGAGMDDYLTKPLELEALSRALRQWSAPGAVTRSDAC